MVHLADQLGLIQIAIGHQEVKEKMMVVCLELTIGYLKPHCASWQRFLHMLSCEENNSGVNKRRGGQNDGLCNILTLPRALLQFGWPQYMSLLFKPPAPGRERGGCG